MGQLDADPSGAALVVLDAIAAEGRVVAATTATGGGVECPDPDEGGDSDCAIVTAKLGPAAMALPVLPATDGGGFADDDAVSTGDADGANNLAMRRKLIAQRARARRRRRIAQLALARRETRKKHNKGQTGAGPAVAAAMRGSSSQSFRQHGWY